MDSWRPRKLEPGLAAQYSKSSERRTSSMKSEPGLTGPDASAAPAGSGPACWASADAIGGKGSEEPRPTSTNQLQLTFSASQGFKPGRTVCVSPTATKRIP